jgi:hypothetical protein
VTASTDTALGHLGEQSFHQIQPTSAGRGEVNVIARVSRQPTSNFGDLVCAVVVHHQMHVQPGGKIILDLVEKAQELLMPVSPVARADGHSGSNIHSRKQRCNSMPLVIMRLPSGNARPQRQNRFGPIQRLDLTLFIHAQHDGTIRWVQVQANDVPHLLHKLRVFGKLEILHAMRL